MINLPSGPFVFPQKPVTIPSDACLIWPFNFDLGHGVRLVWATAQPLTAIDDGNVHTVFFAETEGVPAQFAFETNGPSVEVLSGQLTHRENINLLRDEKPGTKVAARVRLADGGFVQIVVLDYKTSLAIWKGNLQGRDRIFLTEAGLVIDGDNLRLTSTATTDLNVSIYPAPDSLTFNGGDLARKADGVFQRFSPAAPQSVKFKANFKIVQAAGAPREIPMVQVGNEITPGLLLNQLPARRGGGGTPQKISDQPEGSTRDWTILASLLKAGISVVKDVDPRILIVLHIDRGGDNVATRWWVDKALAHGVAFDILGESCYTRWQGPPAKWKANFDDLVTRYPKLSFIIAEYAYETADANEIMHNLPDHRGLGTFIWEPTQRGNQQQLFDSSGAVIPEKMALYDKVVKDYGLKQ